MKLVSSECTHTVLSAGLTSLKLLLQAALLLFVLLSLLLKFAQRALLLQRNAHHRSAWLLSNRCCCMGHQQALHVDRSLRNQTYLDCCFTWKCPAEIVYLSKVLMHCSPPQRIVEQATAMEFDCAYGHPHAPSCVRIYQKKLEIPILSWCTISSSTRLCNISANKLRSITP